MSTLPGISTPFLRVLQHCYSHTSTSPIPRILNTAAQFWNSHQKYSPLKKFIQTLRSLAKSFKALCTWCYMMMFWCLHLWALVIMLSSHSKDWWMNCSDIAGATIVLWWCNFSPCRLLVSWIRLFNLFLHRTICRYIMYLYFVFSNSEILFLTFLLMKFNARSYNWLR